MARIERAGALARISFEGGGCGARWRLVGAEAIDSLGNGGNEGLSGNRAAGDLSAVHTRKFGMRGSRGGRYGASGGSMKCGMIGFGKRI